ncbi:JAB domain-containing protein [Aerococcus sp. UMB8608]|nr:JAB domain-containing protein [Aerococcus sp. UMB8608]
MMEDERVSDLLQFLKYAVEEKEVPTFKFSSVEKCSDFLSTFYLLPSEDEFLIVALNTKNEPIHYKIFNVKESDNKIVTDMFDPTVSKTVAYYKESQENIDRAMSLDRLFDLFGINALDHYFINYEDRSLASFKEGGRTSYPIKQFNSQNIVVGQNINSATHSINHLEDSKKFIQLYCMKNLQGKNIENDSEIINNLLKIALQDLPQEHIYQILYDNNRKIISTNITSVGGINSSIAEPRFLLSGLKDKNVKGVMLVHNHPSGHPEPSQADLHTTSRCVQCAKVMNKEVYDHIIIGKYGNQSISEFVRENAKEYDLEDLAKLKKDNMNREIKQDWSIDIEKE